MAAPWPSTLPDYVMVEGYQHQPPNNTVRTETVSGRIKTRRRSSKKSRPVTFHFEFTEAELTNFETFWTTTLKDGSLPFQDLLDPVGQANRVWLPAEDYSASALGPAQFKVTLKVIRLPDTPA